MLFLSEGEKSAWAGYARTIAATAASPDEYEAGIRANLLPAFDYYIGTLLAAQGDCSRAVEWLEAGAGREADGLSSSAFLLAFLRRHNGAFRRPAAAFERARPFLRFADVPVMKAARERLVRQFTDSLPVFDRPVRILDIGCGDGALTAAFLARLLETGKADRIGEVLLVDASPAMIGLAERIVSEALPDARVTAENARIQDCSISLNGHYDIAMSSLAYHHMPFEEKRCHLARLAPRIDHFLLFDMEGDHDTPERYSPELALSVYQTYGRVMDFVYRSGATEEDVTDCIDSFLMTEVISTLTEPRGIRTEYHMLRSQWHDLFREALGTGFSLRSDSPCYADESVAFFTMHYGRTEGPVTRSSPGRRPSA